MQHVRPPAYKSCMAVSQVIRPEAQEPVIETERANGTLLKADASRPVTQRVGIVQTKAVGGDGGKSRAGCPARQFSRRGQHAAGKDVALYEVGAPTVAFEARVFQGDHLQ